MPRHPDTVTTPNTLLSDARKRLASPHRPGQHMSRSELADAVNTALDRLYPGRDRSAHYVDFRWIGKLERGEHRWPSIERRAALRHVLGAATDKELDLYSPRRTDAVPRLAAGTPRADDEPTARSGITLGTNVEGDWDAWAETNEPPSWSPDLPMRMHDDSTATAAMHWHAGLYPVAQWQLRRLAHDRQSDRLPRADLAAADVGDAAHWYRDLHDAVAVLVQMCALDLSRRSLLRAAPLVGAALVSVERDWLLNLVTRKVEQASEDGGSPAVAATYAMIEMLDEMDNRFGGGHARLAAVNYLSETVLPKLAQTPAGAERTALLAAAAQLTSNTGWMSYDCGGFGLGQMYMTQALRLCAESGERVLAGQIFAGLSHLAVAAGKPAEALNLAEVGLATAAHAGSPLGTMRLHAMRARAHAALRERIKATQALADAEKAIGASTARSDNARCVRYLDEAYLTTEMAHCFSTLADHKNAERHAQLAAQRTTSRGRRRTLSLTVLATARLEGRGKDLEGALDAAHQALGQLKQVSSGRSVEAIRAFHRRLQLYRDEPAVRRFNAEARAVLPPAGKLLEEPRSNQ